jgi:hypothetical protein
MRIDSDYEEKNKGGMTGLQETDMAVICIS